MVTRSARSQLAATLVTQGKLDVAADLYQRRQMPGELGIESSFQGELDPDHRGAQVLVFWESWCPFSQRAVPKLEEFYRRYRSEGLDVVGVTSVNRTATNESVVAFIEDQGISFPIVKEDGHLGDYFGQRGTPFVAVLKDGVMVWENVVSTPEELPATMFKGLLGPETGGE